MIKPKSRKHEDRIKALEKLAEEQRSLLDYFLTTQGYEEITPNCWRGPIRKSELVTPQKSDPWWRFWA